MACKWRRSDVACTSRKLRCSGPTTGQSLVGRTSARSRVNDINPAIAEHLGIVIVDHGSRKSDSNAMLHEFGRLYQETMGASVVEVAHMEIAEPTIEQAIGRCVARGVEAVVIAPYFLSRGRHIQEDIPALVRQAQIKHPGVKCVVAEPIGIDPLLAQLIGNRVENAIKDAGL